MFFTAGQQGTSMTLTAIRIYHSTCKSAGTLGN